MYYVPKSHVVMVLFKNTADLQNSQNSESRDLVRKKMSVKIPFMPKRDLVNYSLKKNHFEG